MFAERRDAADDQHRRATRRLFLHRVGQFCQRAGQRPLRRQRAVVDDRRRFFGWTSVRDERFHDVRELLRSRVTDERAVETREARPVDVDAALGFAFVLIAANQRDRVAAAGVRDGHPRIRRRRHADGNSGNNLEANAVLMEKQAFRSA